MKKLLIAFVIILAITLTVMAFFYKQGATQQASQEIQSANNQTMVANELDIVLREVRKHEQKNK